MLKIWKNEMDPFKLLLMLTIFTGHSRLRSSHLDEISFVSSILPRNSSGTILEKSFFYRTHMIWNSIPPTIRKLESISEFRLNVETHLWDLMLRCDNGERGGIG